MTTFLALYGGETVAGAKLLALTAEPGIVADFASRLLEEPQEREEDAATRELEQGRRNALRMVRSAAE